MNRSGPPYWAAIYFVWISFGLAVAIHAIRSAS
jgi:hypothetical protein